MKNWADILKNLTILTQFGLSFITPLLLCLALSWWLTEKFNLGSWVYIPGVVGDVLSKIPFLDVGIPAILSVYFDWFSGCMQAFIFCMLTVMYIANAAEEG